MLGAEAARWLYAVPVLIVLIATVRWRLKGVLIVKPDEIVLRGWLLQTDAQGHARRRYTREHVARSGWDAIRIEGVLYPRVVWSRFVRNIVFEQVGRPRLLHSLLTSTPGTFEQHVTPGPVVLALLGLGSALWFLARLLWEGLVGLAALSAWGARWLWPHLCRAWNAMEGRAGAWLRSLRSRLHQPQARPGSNTLYESGRSRQLT
jgi:hypothetical protein